MEDREFFGVLGLWELRCKSNQETIILDKINQLFLKYFIPQKTLKLYFKNIFKNIF